MTKRTGNARHIWTEEEVVEHYRKLGRPAPRLVLAGAELGRAIAEGALDLARAAAPIAAVVAPVEPVERRGRMNKTEAAYAAEVLDAGVASGLYTEYKFESIKLRLARGAWFTIDFFVWCTDGPVEAHEVKGHWRESARVRIKVAAENYPFRFIAARKRRKKEGGGWHFEAF